jgi:hypothetical protein
VIRLDGKLHMVVQVDWSGGMPYRSELEPLGSVLARSIAIGGDEIILLFDALIEAGWEPPTDQRVACRVGRAL